MFLTMEGEKDMFESPTPIVHEFHTGDIVHVFEGTGVCQKVSQGYTKPSSYGAPL